MNSLTRSMHQAPSMGVRPFNIFDSFFKDWPSAITKGFSVDIKDNGSNYLVEAEMPGYDRENIDLVVNNGILTIKAERSSENEKDDNGYIFRERSYGSFQRSFQLPKNTDASSIEATLDKGILSVTIPKVEKDNLQKIEVK